jgi:hypothetical protein
MARGTFTSLLTQIFFTSRSVCLTLRRGGFFDRVRGMHERRARQLEKNRDASKTLIFSMYSTSRKKFLRRVARLRRGTRSVRRTCSSERNMWCRCACEHIRSTENTGFFAAL